MVHAYSWLTSGGDTPVRFFLASFMGTKHVTYVNHAFCSMFSAVYPRRAALGIITRSLGARFMNATPAADVYHSTLSMPLAVGCRLGALRIEARAPRTGSA